MRRPNRFLLAAVSLSVLSGCSVVKAPERPDWSIFTLEPAAEPALSPAPADGPVVVVATPESGAGYSTRRMAYTRGEGRLEYFAESRWADTPARLLVPLLRDALARTGAFAAVAASPTRAIPDLVVESEILAFRQELKDETAHFRVVLRVTVVRGEPAPLTLSRTFDEEEPMDAAGPAAGVAAADRAVARLVAEAADFCAGVVSRSATP